MQTAPRFPYMQTAVGYASDSPLAKANFIILLTCSHFVMDNGLRPTSTSQPTSRSASSRCITPLCFDATFHSSCVCSHFIMDNGLPANFHVAAYLKKCKQKVALQLITIHDSAWAIIALAISMDLYVKVGCWHKHTTALHTV